MGVVLTLLADIRRVTGVLVGDVSDADVTAHLTAHRAYESELEVEFDGVRGVVDGWGRFEPGTDVLAAGNVVALVDGDPVVGSWVLESDGVLTLGAEQADDVVVTAYTYDVFGAAADVVAQVIATRAADYDVKLGDQSFSRSQGVASLRALEVSLRKKSLGPIGGYCSAKLLRSDQAPSPTRRSAR